MGGVWGGGWGGGWLEAAEAANKNRMLITRNVSGRRIDWTLGGTGFYRRRSRRTTPMACRAQQLPGRRSFALAAVHRATTHRRRKLNRPIGRRRLINDSDVPVWPEPRPFSIQMAF